MFPSTIKSIELSPLHSEGKQCSWPLTLKSISLNKIDSKNLDQNCEGKKKEEKKITSVNETKENRKMFIDENPFGF